MARTPLLRSLRSLVRLVRISRQTGVPADELAELRTLQRGSSIAPPRRNAAKRDPRREAEPRRSPPPLSRRGFLAGTAAGAAAIALPKSATASRQPTVVIVGGGVAGLTCALTLRDNGYASSVYEASGRVGGRIFSNTSYWEDDQISEWCGELIDTGHATMRRLAERYSLPLDDLRSAEPRLSQDTYIVDGEGYPFAQAVADFNEISDFVAADAGAARYPTLYNSYTAQSVEFDRTSVYDWIESRVPDGHKAPLGQLLDVAYATEFGADTKLQSALNIIYMLGSQPTHHGFDMFGFSDERFRIRDGNQRLPEAIAADLGDAVITSHALVRLVQSAGGRYVCTFARGRGTVEVTADVVILAVPFAILAKIDIARAGFDALKKTAIRELGRAQSSKLQMQFRDRVWTEKGSHPFAPTGSSYSNLGCHTSWDATRCQSGTSGILVHYSGGSATTAVHTRSPFATAADIGVQRDVARGLTQLAPTFPHLAWNNKATQSLPHRSPLFGASYSYWKVGQYTHFAGYESVPQGGVYFCGEHTSVDYQGFMEGGAASGRETALALVRALN